MRTDDILMPVGYGISNYSTGMYMPSRRKAEEMTAEQLRRGLCAKSAGNWHNCEHCAGGCSIGRRLIAIMRGDVQEPKMEPVVHISGIECARNMADKRRAAYSAAHRKAVQTAAQALILVDGGMYKSTAARTVGYTRWENISNIIRLYPDEVESAKRDLLRQGQE